MLSRRDISVLRLMQTTYVTDARALKGQLEWNAVCCTVRYSSELCELVVDYEIFDVIGMQ